MRSDVAEICQSPEFVGDITRDARSMFLATQAINEYVTDVYRRKYWIDEAFQYYFRPELGQNEKEFFRHYLQATVECRRVLEVYEKTHNLRLHELLHHSMKGDK